MSEGRHWIAWARLVVFRESRIGLGESSMVSYDTLAALVVLLSVIILGLSADMISTTSKFYDSYFNFNALAIAVAVLSFSLAAM